MAPKIKTFPYKDLSQMKFGIITVIGFSRYKVDSKNRRKAMWNVQCECGVIREIHIVKTTMSCGCLLVKFQKEKLPKITAKRNEALNTDLNGILNNYIQRARKKSIPFELDKTTFERLIKSNCHYCNIEPKNIIQLRSKYIEREPYFYNGIDRIDSNLGYVLGNCVSCCKICNYAKRNMTSTEFYEWIERIAKWQYKGKNEKAT